MKKLTFLKNLVLVVLTIIVVLGTSNIVFAEENQVLKENSVEEVNNLKTENLQKSENNVDELNSLKITNNVNTLNANNESNLPNTQNTENNTNAGEEQTLTTPVEEEQPQKKSIADLKINAEFWVRTYTGKEQRPNVEVYDGNEKLKLNKDYEIAYKKNVKPGKAKITIIGIGEYTGVVRKYFYIAPQKQKIRNVSFHSSYKKATVTWTKDKYADGYKIYMSNKLDGTYKYVKTVKGKYTTSYTVKGLNPTEEYYFKVRSYKDVDGLKICRKYSNPKTGGKLLSKITLTAHGSGSNRNFNLARACNTINGYVLRPGETFNWFKVVGPASKARGYKEASVFKNGKVDKGYGGGVCQVSSTVYQASKRAGLTIVERHIHSRPVTYIKLGEDATVSYGVQNLRVKNNKNYSIKLVTFAEGQSTTCKIYSLAN